MSMRRSPPRGQASEHAEATNPARPSTHHPRVTPRNSDGDDAILSTAIKETPYGTLRQLANIPKPSTPLRRASSAGPPSHRSRRRTPTAQTRTPGTAQRLGGSARRPNAPTPHGRAAMREVEARRAGLTPGKDRRRSGRLQRETPRDDLRNLSRLLAPKTQPVVPTPEGPGLLRGRFALAGNDDFDDESDPIRPRLSLPPEEEEDEDDSLLLPPRSAGLEDENFTAQSIELPRRAVSEQPNSRLSRGSFGSIRMSDQFADLHSLGVEGVFDSSFAMGRNFDDAVLDMADDMQGENTATLRDMNFERGRISLASGRDTDIRLEVLPTDDTENTFVFTVPQRDVPDVQHSDDPIDSPTADTTENYQWRERDRIHADGPVPLGSPKDVEVNELNPENTLQDRDTSGIIISKTTRKKKKVQLSKYGIQYPSLPAGVVKKLATQYARTSGNGKAKISKDTLDAIMQASDWFFEQVSDDLGAYSKHAGRKTIDESDIITLMKRQRQTNATATPFSLAQRFLPRELLQELRMIPPSKLKRGHLLEQLEETDKE